MFVGRRISVVDERDLKMMKVECQVCMHHCNLADGEIGICRARKNVNGTIISTNYGKITSNGLDPIENKPLHYFFPGSSILSVGSYGCNMKCQYCQNFSIAQVGESEAEIIFMTPEQLVEKAISLMPKGNIGVAFTYNEPLIGYEFVRDTAKLLKKCGLKVVVVTNGAVSEMVANEILPYVDAMNIDLKCFTENYYKKLGGDLETVKSFIRLAAEKCHVELTALIVPKENDSEEEMREMAQWIASIDENIPLHISRFYPAWEMEHVGATNMYKLSDLADIARVYLNHVHTEI